MSRPAAAVCVALIAAALAAASLARSQEASASALASLAYDRNGSIFTVVADGTSRHRLVGAPGRHLFSGDFQPAWSPDSSTIAFVRERKIARFRDATDIHLIGSNGSGETAVLRGNRSTGYFDPEWAPDGQHISVIRFHETGSSLTSAVVITSPDGSDGHAIAKLHLDETAMRFTAYFDATWSPNGAQLAVTRERIDRHGYFRSSLLSMSSEGADIRLLARDAADASYSPDGSQIAYASTADRHGHNCDEDNCTYDGEIYLANSDGGHPVRLTNSLADDEAPDWSADGRRIAFQSSELMRRSHFLKSSQLFTVAPSSKCLYELRGAGSYSADPDWESDRSLSSSASACQ